jgi:hypothetical protein
MSQAQFSREVKRHLKVRTTPHVIKCNGGDSIKVRDRHWIGLSWKNH